MHAYYGVTQLHSASPTLLETVHQLENSSAIGPATPGGLYNNNSITAISNGPMPPNEAAILTPLAVDGTAADSSSFNSDAAVALTDPSLTSSNYHSDSSLASSVADMAGYSSSSYFTPISTAPNLLFRSPSLYNQGASSMPNNPPLLPPTINSPPIQMAAPTTVSSPCNSSWQHTVPVSMPWMSSPFNPTTIKFTATHGRPTVCEMVKSDAYRRMKRRHDQDENGFSESGGKVHVNEERMAARMQELTLDNNNVDWAPDLEESWHTTRPGPSSSHSSHRDKSLSGRNSTGLPKLEVSDLLKMNFSTKEILPQVILDQISKPCMELVLWKPPGNFVTDVVQNITGKKSVSSLPDNGFVGSSHAEQHFDDLWAVDQQNNGGNNNIEIDPAAVPLPDDDDMEL